MCPSGYAPQFISKLTDSRVKKKLFIHNRDEEFSPRYHPELRFQVGTFKRSNLPTSLDCYNGLLRHRLLCSSSVKSLLRVTGEFSLGIPSRGFGIPVRCRCWAHTLLSQLADGMAYYSCHDFYFYYRSRFKANLYLLWTQRDSNPRPSQCH